MGGGVLGVSGAGPLGMDASVDGDTDCRSSCRIGGIHLWAGG